MPGKRKVTVDELTPLLNATQEGDSKTPTDIKNDLKYFKNLDKNNLIPNLNFIDKSPYQKIKKFNSISKNSNIKATSLDKAINKYWNGNFKEFIKDTEIYK